MQTPRVQSEASSVEEIVNRRPTQVEVKKVDGSAQVLLIPNGMHATSVKPLLDEYATQPDRREGTAMFFDLESLIAHANRFKDKDSAVFAHPGKMSPEGAVQKKPRMLSVIDYHRATHEGTPRFGEHRGLYEFPLSEPWQFWLVNNNRKFSQVQFAQLIEDRIADLCETSNPSEAVAHLASLLETRLGDPSELLKISKGLQIHENSRLAEHVNLSTGETRFDFKSEHTDGEGGSVKVPGAFLVGIPVFENGMHYQIGARLRYRYAGGAVTWWYSLYRPERTFEYAFTEACNKVKKDTELPLFIGSPESCSSNVSDDE